MIKRSPIRLLSTNNTSHLLLLLLSISLFYACNTNQKPQFVSTHNTQLIDTIGKSLILKGLNLMDKSKKNGHFEGINQATFDSIASWNMNVVRLGIFWSAIEPTPDKINEAYLKQLDECIQQAKNAGLYVLLDMHQDLYSEKYNGDGAPNWACLDEGLPNTVLGGSWDDAYFTSPAIQTAFDNFWRNKKAADSVGLQDHYAKAWAAIAKRYANNTTIIGYDIMNEPFIGSAINKVQNTYFTILANELKIKDATQLMTSWMSPQGRTTIMRKLKDTTLYKKVMDATANIYGEYEKHFLQPFYNKIFKAINAVDQNHLLFIEPSVSVNIGVQSQIQNTFNNRMVYAPHVYDIVTDSENSEDFSAERLTLIINRIKATQDKLQVPVVIGEWGAFYGANNKVLEKEAQFILQHFKNNGWGNIYWSYENGLNKRIYFKTLINQ